MPAPAQSMPCKQCFVLCIGQLLCHGMLVLASTPLQWYEDKISTPLRPASQPAWLTIWPASELPACIRAACLLWGLSQLSPLRKPQEAPTRIHISSEASLARRAPDLANKKNLRDRLPDSLQHISQPDHYCQRDLSVCAPVGQEQHLIDAKGQSRPTVTSQPVQESTVHVRFLDARAR